MSTQEVSHIDWNHIKQMANDALNTLQPILDILPLGLPKTILNVIVAGLHALVSLLPSE